jgi:hypothetical protein
MDPLLVDLHLGDPPENNPLSHPAPCRSTRRRNPHSMMPYAMQATPEQTIDLQLSTRGRPPLSRPLWPARLSKKRWRRAGKDRWTLNCAEKRENGMDFMNNC